MAARVDDLSEHFKGVHPAYRQVADQLRDMILDGRLMAGTRLPDESDLAGQIGVSRATLRESFRTLTAEGLLRTAKGRKGGSYVTTPTVANLSGNIAKNISLMSINQPIDLAAFMECREIVEVPATGLAAERHTEDDLQRLQDTLPPAGQEYCVHNSRFHFTLVEMSHNLLLEIAMQTVVVALESQLDLNRLGRDFYEIDLEHHQMLIEAIRDRDTAASQHIMKEHLAWLAIQFQAGWRKMELSYAKG
jgi:DNA-binding FadR family transcriptional regulator